MAARTTLAHHIDIDFLREAYRRTRKGGAVGIDGQTAADFARDLEGNLGQLLELLKSATGRRPSDGSTSRRRTGSSGRSGSRPSRTRSCSRPSRWC